MRLLIATIGIAGSLVLPGIAVGSEPGSGTVEQFAQRLVRAINGGSPERRLGLVHSASRACVTSESRPFYVDMFARQSRDSILPGYRLSIEAIPSDKPLMFEGELDYPVRPTHSLQIDHDTGPNRSRLIFIYVARDQGVWSEVLGCPRPQTVARMKAKAHESSALEVKAKRLAATVPESLRASLLELLRQGRKIDAIKTYASATHEDLVTSRRVVELVASESR